MPFTEVTDPDVLKKLEKSGGRRPAFTPVEDPDLIKKLEAQTAQGPTNEESPLDFVTRSQLGIKITPQGKVGFLKTLPNVMDARMVEGEPQITTDGKTWKRVDVPGMEWGDFADLTGIALEALPELITGFVTANPIAAAAAGAGGSVLRQAVSAALPGEEELGIGERVGMVGTNAALAGGTQYGINKLMPQNAIARGARSADDMARAGREFSEQAGIDLSIAQTTGKKSHQLYEAALSENIYVGDQFTRFAQRQSVQAYNKLKGMVDNMAPGGDLTMSGERIIKAVDDALYGLKSARAAQGARDFAEVSRLVGTAADGSTSKAVFHLDNFRDVAGKWLAELDVPGAAPESRAIAKQLSNTLEDLSNVEAITPGHMTKLLSNWSRRTTFTTEERATAAKVAKELMSGLDDDMTEAAARYSDNVPLVEAIKTARDNWRRGSSAIRSAQKLPLSKMVDENLDVVDPDLVLDKILRMKPTTLKRTVAMMRKADPEITSELKGAWLQRVLDAAADTKAEMETFVDPMEPVSGLFSKDKALSFMKKNWEWAKAAFDTRELLEIRSIMGALQRATSNPYAKGSRTTPVKLVTSHIQDGIGIVGIPRALYNGTVLWVGYKQLANAMLTRGGRNAISTVATAKELTHPVLQSLTYMLELSGQERVRSAGIAPSVGQAIVRPVVPQAEAAQPIMNTVPFMMESPVQLPGTQQGSPQQRLNDEQRRIQQFMRQGAI